MAEEQNQNPSSSGDKGQQANPPPPANPQVEINPQTDKASDDWFKKDYLTKRKPPRGS